MVLSTSFMAIPPTFSGYRGIGEGGSKSFMRVKGVKVLLHELCELQIHGERQKEEKRQLSRRAPGLKHSFFLFGT